MYKKKQNKTKQTIKKHISIFQEIQANFENSSIPPSRQSGNIFQTSDRGYEPEVERIF